MRKHRSLALLGLTLLAVGACAGQSADDGFDAGFAQGFEEGYAQGLEDARPGAGGAGGQATAELTDGELLSYMGGFWDGLLLQSYPCASNVECVTGEVCRDGLCLPPAPCDEPHPLSDRAKCATDCAKRYPAVVRSKACLQSCLCSEYQGEAICLDEENCKLPWTDCVEGACQDNDLTPREMFPLP